MCESLIINSTTVYNNLYEKKIYYVRIDKIIIKAWIEFKYYMKMTKVKAVNRSKTNDRYPITPLLCAKVHGSGVTNIHYSAKTRQHDGCYNPFLEPLF